MNRALSFTALVVASVAACALTGCSSSQQAHNSQWSPSTSGSSCCTKQVSSASRLNLSLAASNAVAPRRALSTHIGPNPYAGKRPNLHLALGAGDSAGTMVAMTTFALPSTGMGFATVPTDP
jgi:hypothetical protein